VHDAIFVPLAKWAMLIAGNYRCVLKDSVRPIKDAVHSDIAASRAMYNWVVKLCVTLGAKESDLVPFEKYANAALSLGSPSSRRARSPTARQHRARRLLVKTIAAQRACARRCSIRRSPWSKAGWRRTARRPRKAGTVVPARHHVASREAIRW